MKEDSKRSKRLKVIHLTFCFHPDSMGGTEIYVAGLAKELSKLNVESVIAAPSTLTNSYVVDGIRVRRFATHQHISDPSEIYGEGDDLAAQEFSCVLDDEQPDIVHLHAFTSGVSLKVVRAAKVRGIPVVYTYHTPTATCQRGTMMHWGTEPCNGLMRLNDCARCTLEGIVNSKSVVDSSMSKIGKAGAQLCGSLPAGFGAFLRKCGLRGGVWTALRMTELVRLRHSTTQNMLVEVDHVVAVCDWVQQVLLRNGVPGTKLTLCRQGIAVVADLSKDNSRAVMTDRTIASSELRICFLGRLDPTKGIHILLQAIRSIPHAALRLDVYGVAQGKGGRDYEQTLRLLAMGDDRIEFVPPVPATEIVETLKRYDLLAVPSQWLETGPLVVLEAFAAGVPVIGSRLGGIVELVEDGVNGLLVEASSVTAWKMSLQRLCLEPKLIESLRSEVKAPRTMKIVSEEMISLYEGLVRHTTRQV